MSIYLYAGDIERNKVRGDLGITYDMEVMRLIDDLRGYNLDVNSVVITRYENQPAATILINKLERRGIKVYRHGPPNSIYSLSKLSTLSSIYFDCSSRYLEVS